MGKRVSQLVRMNVAKTSLVRTIADDLVDAVAGHRARSSEPEVRPVHVSMPCPSAQIPIERPRRLLAEGAGTRPTSLPQHARNIEIEVEVVTSQAAQFPEAHARIEQEQDDREIAPLGELRAIA
jgi:hypothetical protein